MSTLQCCSKSQTLNLVLVTFVVDRALDEETFNSVCFRPKCRRQAAASPGQLISPSDRFYHRGCAHQFRHRFNPLGPAPGTHDLCPRASPMPQPLAKWAEKGCEAGERARQLVRSESLPEISHGFFPGVRTLGAAGVMSRLVLEMVLRPAFGHLLAAVDQHSGPQTDACGWEMRCGLRFMCSAKSSVFGGFLSRGQK